MTAFSGSTNALSNCLSWSINLCRSNSFGNAPMKDITFSLIGFGVVKYEKWTEPKISLPSNMGNDMSIRDEYRGEEQGRNTRG